jgi:hypothetical protein
LTRRRRYGDEEVHTTRIGAAIEHMLVPGFRGLCAGPFVFGGKASELEG